MAPFPASRPAAHFARPLLFLFPLLAALALLGLTARPAQATIYYAAITGLHANSGLSWSSPRDLASALAGATNGDQVWVKAGTYTGSYIGTDGVALYGGFAGTETSIGQRNIAANPTIIDGGSKRTPYTILSSATHANSIDGFTIQNGYTTGNGGGILDSSTSDTLNVANCTFSKNNVGGNGGGIADESNSLTLSNSTFTGNTGSSDNNYGAGVYAANIVMASGCTFNSNESGDTGGGVFADAVTANNCTFNGNIAANYGGAIFGISQTTVTGCTFTSDSASIYGGGIYGNFSTITNCIFRNNSASSGTGGCIQGGNSTITNSTFTDNTAADGGVFYGAGTIIGCNFSGNSATQVGGAIYASGAGTVTSCTFDNNTATDGSAIIGNSSIYSVSVASCTFTNNMASGTSGAVSNCDDVTDCTFMESSPAAIYAASTGGAGTPTLIEDNLIIGASASPTGPGGPDGIDINTVASGATDYLTIANNTIINANIGIDDNTGSGVVTVANNIYYGNYGALDNTGSDTFLTYTNDVFDNVGYGYQGVPTGPTDLAVDPMFVNASTGNYRLTTTSPLVDMGTDSYVNPGDTDLDGNPRILGLHVDIGAYEVVENKATLTALSPGTVQATHADFTLTLTGTAFVNGAVAEWNGTILTTTYVSATQLTATVPASLVASPGTASVTVVNPQAIASNALTFTVSAAPTLTALSPTSVQAGSAQFMLTLTGTGFVSGSIVDWNGVALATTEISATELTAVVPASDVAATGTATVTVTNPNVAPTAALTFTITNPTAILTSISPSSALAGSGSVVVTLTGSDFASGATAEWNGTAVQTAVFTANIAVAFIPASDLASPGTAQVTVVNSGTPASNAEPFTVTPPTITSISPTSGPVGTVVTITGANFIDVTRVRFHNASATTYSVNSAGTQITVTVPGGAGTGTITVNEPNVSVTSSQTFTVTVPPTVTSFTPTSGPVGTSVTITGTNFTGATSVKFNMTTATTFHVASATSITATVPISATTGTVSVTTPGGTATSSASFTVLPAPTITSFTPTSGPVGTSVTITGTNFTGTISVKFNGTAAASFTVVSATSITATVPTGATTGTITVTTPGGTATSASNFTVLPAPTITSFTPTSGPVGTIVTITGTNLGGVTKVRFHNASAATFSANGAGTQITVTVPTGTGTGTITVTTPGGSVTSAQTYTLTH